MSVVIIPRKHLRMPQGRVRVSDEWLDTGLGAVILPRYGARNLVTGIAGVGGQSQRAGQYGVAARCTVASDAADVGISAVGTRAFTWLTVSKFDSPGGTSWGGFAAAKRGTQYLWALMRQANGQPALYYRLWTGSGHGSETNYVLPAFGSGGIEYISGAQAGLIGFAFDASAGTGTNATVVRQYRDGVEQTNTTTISQSGTFDMSAEGSFFRAGGNHDGPYGAPQYAPWPHDLWMTLYWPTVALPSELAQDLQRAPYQVLAADPIRIYSFPSGPISLTINSITASNITSSGARITLGVTR